MRSVILMLLVAVLLCAPIFTGCSLTGSNRADAVKAHWEENGKAKQEYYKAKQAQYKANISDADKKPNPTTRVTVFDTQGNKVAVMETDVAPAISAATGHYEIDPDAQILADQEMPRSETAEVVEAGFDGATKLAGTPAVVGGMVGASVVGALKAVGGGGQKINTGGGDLNMTDSMKTNKEIALSSSGDGDPAVSTSQDNHTEIPLEEEAEEEVVEEAAATE